MLTSLWFCLLNSQCYRQQILQNTRNSIYKYWMTWYCMIWIHSFIRMLDNLFSWTECKKVREKCFKTLNPKCRKLFVLCFIQTFCMIQSNVTLTFHSFNHGESPNTIYGNHLAIKLVLPTSLLVNFLNTYLDLISSNNMRGMYYCLALYLKSICT